jgi:hypothetical protein
MPAVDLATGTGSDLVFAEAPRARQYMVRSKTHKLLLCRDEAHSQFFDLARDPFEMDNRIDDPACRDEIEIMRGRLLRWALFDSPSRVHLDRDAASIAGENVPLPDDGHVDEALAYLQKKMAEPLDLAG